MKLFFQKLGQGSPIIILHGLYGSSDNWVTIARNLANQYTVYLVDQRNHGKSPHHPVHSYLSMSDDLDEFIVSEGIENPILIGHSMGGKTAMLYAASHPDKVTGIVVVDIGPGGYANVDSLSPMVIAHLNIMSSMLSVDFLKYTTRSEIESKLAETILDVNVRQFIMKNVQRNVDNTFSWKFNLDALSNALPEIMGPVKLEKILKDNTNCSFPVFFIKGECSGYISNEQQSLIYKYFPAAKIEVVQKSGHWVHAEQPVLFLEKLSQILRAIQFQ